MTMAPMDPHDHASSPTMILLPVFESIDEEDLHHHHEHPGDILQDKILVLQCMRIVSYGIMLLWSIALIIYMRHNRHVARQGDSKAAQKIILPTFEPFLWFFGGVTGMYTFAFAISILTQSQFAHKFSIVHNEIMLAASEFVRLVIVMLMLQKSVSIPALKRTVLLTMGLSWYTVPIVYCLNASWATPQVNGNLYFWILIVARSGMLMPYVYVLLRPPSRATKQTLREVCVFGIVSHGWLMVATGLLRAHLVTAGFRVLFLSVLWASLSPLFMWRILKADTEHWRGFSQLAIGPNRLQTSASGRALTHFHDRLSSEGLHVLIEMHRKFIIDFAYLEIKERIGVGANAQVYAGRLHTKIPVAVKVYTPQCVTEETVMEFSQEAALCGTLHHPNIVKFYGMCVSPPTICLVSELCRGSLEDVLQANGAPKRHQLLRSVAYMLDAARAIAYIHSFSPAFIHRDIKPSNFLVDADHTVKLTDFGESRALPRHEVADTPQDHVTISVDTKSSETSDEDDLAATLLTVKGTVDYMAPEIIRGKAGMASYGEAADVYALVMTFWDILHPHVEKFPHLKNHHLHIYESVVEGERPLMDEHVHPQLRHVIESGWQAEPQLRPSARAIVNVLETIQEEMGAVMALELCQELGAASVVAGNVVVHHMQQSLDCVNIPSDAVRLGNALMDAGLLHHAKHARSFEHSDELYYFDEEAIVRNQPIAIMDATGLVMENQTDAMMLLQEEAPCESSGTKRPRPSMDRLLVKNGCACRKLGQRILMKKGMAIARRRHVRLPKVLQQEDHLTSKLLDIDDALLPKMMEEDEEDEEAKAFDAFPTFYSAMHG